MDNKFSRTDKQTVGDPKRRKLQTATLPRAFTQSCETILHIDDDPNFCRAAAHILRGRGYEVTSISDPMQAMQKVDEVRPAVVLLDICMEGRSGLQILRDLQMYDRGIQVVMLTGLVAEKTLIDAHAMGAVGCLFKPVEDWQLLSNLIDGSMCRNRSWRDVLARAIKDKPASAPVAATPVRHT